VIASGVPKTGVDPEVRGDGRGAVNLREKGVVGLQNARNGVRNKVAKLVKSQRNWGPVIFHSISRQLLRTS